MAKTTDPRFLAQNMIVTSDPKAVGNWQFTDLATELNKFCTQHNEPGMTSPDISNTSTTMTKLGVQQYQHS